MYRRFLMAWLFSVSAMATLPAPLMAQEQPEPQKCAVEDRPCLLAALEESAGKVDTLTWRDQTYRELAKTYAADGDYKRAVTFIDKIETPDTKAMTIRGIGMASAGFKHSPDTYKEIFSTLRTEAEKITHPPSYAIALTYIAMAQAFAGDNEGAWATATDMENEALRHKAYGETAEIQAEKGDFKSARISIEKISSLSFRNKAYETITKILADRNFLADAYDAALLIDNPYKKAQAIQYILDIQKPREIPHQ